MTPAGTAASGTSTPLPDGTTVYRGSDPNVGTVVEPTGDGAQIASVTLSDSGDVQTYRYHVQLPLLASLQPGADGGVNIVLAATAVIGHFAAPWAKDATGTLLTTYYRIEGSDLVQVVDTTQAVFPVVADPRVETLTVSILGLKFARAAKIWFSRTETSRLYRARAQSATVGVLAGAGCSALTGGTLIALCLTAASYVAVDFVTNVESAHRKNHCLTLELGLPRAIDWDEGDGRFCVHPKR